MTEFSGIEKKSWMKYRLFLVCIFVTLLSLLGRMIFNALYSLFVLTNIISVYGFGILNDAARNDLIAGFTSNYFSFSWKSVITLFIILVAWAVYWKFMVYLTAQFILPVTFSSDRKKATKRLALFISGGHGAAVFVKEGTIIERKWESSSKKKQKVRPGVALVDLSSAAILSQEEDTHAWNLLDSQDEDFDGLTRRIAIHKENKKKVPFVETRGPGLVFTEKGQKIFNVVDLRRQSRSKKVEAYTRDGIKLSTNVKVEFSLSDEAEAIPVGFIGEELRWLDIEKTSDGQKIIVRGSFDLDEQDKQELLNYFRNKATGSYAPEEPDRASAITPYKFYPTRVFNAAYSKARSLSTGEFAPWYDAPLEIAVDVFRKGLASVPFDSLYNGFDNQQREIDSAASQSRPSALTLKELKDNFARRVKLKGIVHFQFYIRKRDEPFPVGEAVDLRQVSQHPVMALSKSKFNSLRSVGVAIKSASFGDLQPVNPEIKKKMIDNWKAKWDKEVHFINAEYELEAVRVRNRNRAQIQQEMTYLLAGIFQSSHTDEALALRVFQALESAATNPTANSDLSPKEIVSMLDSLHKWLLVERKEALESPPQLGTKTSEG